MALVKGPMPLEQAEGSEALLAELILAQPSSAATEESYSASALRDLVIGGCIGPCLKMTRVSELLMKAAMAQTGEASPSRLSSRVH